MPAVPISEIVTFVSGRYAGPADLLLDGVQPLAAAGPTHLSFLSNPKYAAQIETSRNTQALALSDRLLELMDAYCDLRGEAEDRLKRAEFVRLFANLAGSRSALSQRWQGMLDRSILMHRAIVGNVNAVYLADWLFAAESEVQ